ncbi:uncharacterized protein LOC120037143 isoform X1 [Salvelinus namaycush]|uniref:Uncharacterized protein LOC120037143 isoform X1 n=1 Tax=Salvelinus namaycush TaxID=8040 RepID=A0A8U0QA66_SALNM|nr:uncharacterized protein LOC120037143 isoform X1 [Salvelinus namaycush]
MQPIIHRRDAEVWHQTRSLFYKNLLIKWRTKKQSLQELILPLLLLCLLFLISILNPHVYYGGISTMELDTVHFSVLNVLGYTPANNATNHIMEQVAQEMNIPGRLESFSSEEDLENASLYEPSGYVGVVFIGSIQTSYRLRFPHDRLPIPTSYRLRFPHDRLPIPTSYRLRFPHDRLPIPTSYRLRFPHDRLPIPTSYRLHFPHDRLPIPTSYRLHFPHDRLPIPTSYRLHFPHDRLPIPTSYRLHFPHDRLPIPTSYRLRFPHDRLPIPTSYRLHFPHDRLPIPTSYRLRFPHHRLPIPTSYRLHFPHHRLPMPSDYTQNVVCVVYWRRWTFPTVSSYSVETSLTLTGTTIDPTQAGAHQRT